MKNFTLSLLLLLSGSLYAQRDSILIKTPKPQNPKTPAAARDERINNNFKTAVSNRFLTTTNPTTYAARTVCVCVE
jgi:hypothetical protein